MAPLLSNSVSKVVIQIVCTWRYITLVFQDCHLVFGDTLKRTRLAEFLDSAHTLPGLQTSARRVASENVVGSRKFENVWRRFESAIGTAVITRVLAVWDLFVPKRRFVPVEKKCLVELRSSHPVPLAPQGSFTAINYDTKHHAWQCSGFDLHSKSWKALLPFSYLPRPDPELFKEYSVTGHGGLMCAEVSKLPKKGELVVFIPWTGESKALPSLLHPRNPVLVHISVVMAPLLSNSVSKVVYQIACTWRYFALQILEVLLQNFHLVIGDTLRRTRLAEFLDSPQWHTLWHTLPGLQTSARRVASESVVGCSNFENVWRRFESAIGTAVITTVLAVWDLFLPKKRFVSVEKKCLVELCSSHPACLAPQGSFTAINFYIKDHAWQCSGFDLHSKSWSSLPTFSCLPPPDPELFKEYSVTGHGGLMCAEVSKSPKKGELVVFNPVTGKSKALPSLLHPRNPVLVHISVNSAQRSYKVIVAGSSTAGDEHLSRKMEVFDSSTSEWKETCDLPGPAFGLNEHQAGVCVDGTLFFISFLEGDGGRGVVAFDVEKGEWVKHMTCPIPFSSYSNTLQLVENDGRLYLFSEQERGASVEHCIDELEFWNPKAGGTWRRVVQVKKSSGRGLLVYPEYTCVGFGEGKLCIFNALSRVGAVYDMRDRRSWEEFHRASRLRFFGACQLTPSYFMTVPLFLLASMPNGAAADDQSGKLNQVTIVSDIRDHAKIAAVTTLLALVLSVGLIRKFIVRDVGGVNHQLQGNDFDIMEGLERSDIPAKSNNVFEILPEIP